MVIIRKAIATVLITNDNTNNNDSNNDNGNKNTTETINNKIIGIEYSAIHNES